MPLLSCHLNHEVVVIWLMISSYYKRLFIFRITTISHRIDLSQCGSTTKNIIRCTGFFVLSNMFCVIHCKATCQRHFAKSGKPAQRTRLKVLIKAGIPPSRSTCPLTPVDTALARAGKHDLGKQLTRSVSLRKPGFVRWIKMASYLALLSTRSHNNSGL